MAMSPTSMPWAGGNSSSSSKLRNAGCGRPPLSRLPLSVRNTVKRSRSAGSSTGMSTGVARHHQQRMSDCRSHHTGKVCMPGILLAGRRAGNVSAHGRAGALAQHSTAS